MNNGHLIKLEQKDITIKNFISYLYINSCKSQIAKKLEDFLPLYELWYFIKNNYRKNTRKLLSILIVRKNDFWLKLAADTVVEALKMSNSLGCKYLRYL